MVRTRLKLAATLAAVVLALTGFHTGKGGHGSGTSKSRSGKSRSSKGGGCSNDGKSNDDYEGSVTSGQASTATASATAEPSPTAKVEVVVVECVEPERKKAAGKSARKADTTATLRITSHDALPGTYEVTLYFEGATGAVVDSSRARVTVDAYDVKTFQVAMGNPKSVSTVKRCRVGDVREQDATAIPVPTASPTPTASGSPSSAG
ncbi:hypothetical protein ACFW2Y_21530 [Streptomyces sp. NPDC058877]|uniref:hypothetical protein n=1 Tax=unclassified Streptomyces TaxID=2593676 RepID=UPI0036C1DDF7